MAPALGRFFPLSPPSDVLSAVAAAGERAAELARRDRQLHFELDPATGRVVVEARDLAGNVLRTLSGAEALEVMSGAEL